MKIMTCKELGGACEMKFHANTFEEMAELSKNHVAKMFKENSQPHLMAANEMRELCKSPEDMKKWFDNKRNEFEALPHNK